MEKSIIAAFHKLGLSEHESPVLLAVLVAGRASAVQVGRTVNLSRQTTYSILKALSEQGYIEQTTQGRSTFFTTTLEHVLYVCENSRLKIEQSKATLLVELPKIIARQKGVELPKVRYYEGVAGLEQMFEGILREYSKSALPKVFRAYGVNNMRAALGEYLHEFVRARGTLGVETHLFIGQGEDDLGIEQEQLGRVVKRLNIKPQKAGVYLVGKRLYLFSFPDRVGVMVENAMIVELLTAVFDDHWAKS